MNYEANNNKYFLMFGTVMIFAVSEKNIFCNKKCASETNNK